jgi:hypothetical protein
MTSNDMRDLASRLEILSKIIPSQIEIAMLSPEILVCLSSLSTSGVSSGMKQYPRARDGLGRMGGSSLRDSIASRSRAQSPLRQRAGISAERFRLTRPDPSTADLAFCFLCFTPPSIRMTDSNGIAMSLSDRSLDRETSCTDPDESRRVKKCRFSDARLRLVSTTRHLDLRPRWV